MSSPNSNKLTNTNCFLQLGSQFDEHPLQASGVPGGGEDILDVPRLLAELEEGLSVERTSTGHGQPSHVLVEGHPVSRDVFNAIVASRVAKNTTTMNSADVFSAIVASRLAKNTTTMKGSNDSSGR